MLVFRNRLQLSAIIARAPLVAQFSTERHSAESECRAPPKKENIGLTGIARNPEAKAELLAAYRSLESRLQMSSLPTDYPYRTSLLAYLGSSIRALTSSNPEDLCARTGMQYEQLLEECAGERALMEALEHDQTHEFGDCE